MSRMVMAFALCVLAPIASARHANSTLLIAEQQTLEKPFQRFEDTWRFFRLAAEHQTGRIDGPLRTMATWPVERMHRVRHDLRLIRMVVGAAENGTGFASLPAVRTATLRVEALSLRLDQLAPLLGLPREVMGPYADPRLAVLLNGPLRRAIAVIMANAVAMQTDLMLAAVGDLQMTGAARPSSSSVTRIIDGERSTIWSAAVYWDVARIALDLVADVPRSANFVREWYHASTEFLLSRREYDAALPHAAHGIVAMQTDARMLFYLGVFMENLASPSVQAAVGDNPASAGLEHKEVLIGRAEKALKDALAMNPALDEAALRLARVYLITGRHDDAASLLERIEPTLHTPELRYYASLFLGRAHEARGRDADARAAYERARGLFPDAQSPHLALAAVFWRAGDAAGSAGEVRALALTREPPKTIDPWWMYDVSPADSLLERLAAARRALDAFLNASGK